MQRPRRYTYAVSCTAANQYMHAALESFRGHPEYGTSPVAGSGSVRSFGADRMAAAQLSQSFGVRSGMPHINTVTGQTRTLRAGIDVNGECVFGRMTQTSD